MPNPMADGGKWLAISYGAVPLYAIGEDTIKRLLSSGWVEVPDPREEVAETPVEETLAPEASSGKRSRKSQAADVPPQASVESEVEGGA